ncbi:hypothetical protein C8F01DRAFT_1130055 [Mycena amicta]|nr:hypothetical protein C8F01DRAFT_1130055 [Mycena amicta]
MAPYTAGGRSPKCSVPVELWDIILREDVSDEALLSIATVCHLFHAISIRIALQNSGLSHSVYAEEELRLTPYTLRLLHLSFRTFAVRKMDVTLAGADNNLHRDLVLLHDVVRASKHLEQLDIRFGCDLLDAKTTPNQATVLRALAKVLGSLADRVSGPVIVLFEEAVFDCRPSDVASWNLDVLDGQFCAEMTPLTAEQRARNPPGSMFHRTEATLSSGQQTYIFSLDTLASVSIDCTPTVDTRPFSLITLDPPRISFLNICPARKAGIAGDAAAVILSYARLPVLRNLRVDFQPNILPVFTDFLQRHPTIEKLTATDFASGNSLIGAADSPLEPPFPPLAHSGITTLDTDCFSTSGALPSTLPSLASSPKLCALSYHLRHRPNPCIIQGFVHDLRILSRLPPDRDISLTFEMSQDDESYEGDAAYWYQHPAVLALAPALQCVRKLELSVHSVREARHMLTFTALLPALPSLYIAVFSQKSLERYLQDEPELLDEAEKRAAAQQQARELEEKAQWATEFAAEVREKLGGGVPVVNVQVKIY